MTSFIRRLWWRLSLPAGWDTVKRTVHHASLGEVKYEGRRDRPGGHVHGIWRVVNPDSGRQISVGFPTLGDEPTPFYLDQLATVLADPDGLFERFRAAIAPQYQQWTDTPLPADWRSAFRLDTIDLQPAPDDIDEEFPGWQVTYWCPPAEHWFVIYLEGDVITDVNVEG